MRDHLETLPQWVLVVDNADNLGLFGVGHPTQGDRSQKANNPLNLYDFIPRGPVGTILWTSRDRQITALVGVQQAIEVVKMKESEAIALLETGRGKMTGDEIGDAQTLLVELEWLPLAISQAAAYMRRTDEPIAGYLSMIQKEKNRWKTLKNPEFDRHRRTQVPNSILETWNVSINLIRQESTLAYDIMHVLAFMDHQSIPLEIIHETAQVRMNAGDNISTADNVASTIKKDGNGSEEDSYSSESDSDSEKDDISREAKEAIARLQQFSFLGDRLHENKTRSYEMHKLVQDATRYGIKKLMDRHRRGYYARIAFDVIDRLFPTSRREVWRECEKYLLHAQRAGEWAKMHRGEERVSALLERVSGFMHDRGRWREKEPVNKKALQLRREVLGEKHPDTIRSMADLAATYHA